MQLKLEIQHFFQRHPSKQSKTPADIDISGGETATTITVDESNSMNEPAYDGANVQFIDIINHFVHMPPRFLWQRHGKI